jgi:two-component system, OmpR family, response regulator
MQGRLPRALVVDDNELGAIATSALLAAEGFESKTALGGLAAVEMLEHWLPDIILLDITMPEFDGFAVASVVRAIGATSDLGIIAMTGLDESAFRSRGPIGAFDGFFRRAESERTLLALIDDILVRSGAAG